MMPPRKCLPGPTSKKSTMQIYPLEKYTFRQKPLEKITIKGSLGLLHPWPCMYKKWNSPILQNFQERKLVFSRISKESKNSKVVFRKAYPQRSCLDFFSGIIHEGRKKNVFVICVFGGGTLVDF